MTHKPIDPIEELFNAVQDGRLPLAWIVRYGQNGQDPVLNAYYASKDPIHMRWLLYDLDVIALGAMGAYCKDCDNHGATHHCQECAKIIRTLVPKPPTIDDVLAYIDARNGAKPRRA